MPWQLCVGVSEATTRARDRPASQHGPLKVRVGLDSGHGADILGSPFRARSGHWDSATARQEHDPNVRSRARPHLRSSPARIWRSETKAVPRGRGRPFRINSIQTRQTTDSNPWRGKTLSLRGLLRLHPRYAPPVRSSIAHVLSNFAKNIIRRTAINYCIGLITSDCFDKLSGSTSQVKCIEKNEFNVTLPGPSFCLIRL